MSAKELGSQLRAARLARGLTLAQAADTTHIRSHYLQAIEDGELELLPSPAQVHGFIRVYAKQLELNPDPLLALLKPKVAEAATAEPATAQAQSSPPEPAIQSQFVAIGAQLRERRESLELIPLEVEEHTHIPEHYVARLEKGDFDSFPSPTQARGMLGNYADFLGLESGVLLASYADALQQRFELRQAAKPKARPALKLEIPKFSWKLPGWARPMLNRDVMFGGLAGLALLIFVIFSIGRIAATSAGQGPEPTAPPLALLANDATATQGTPGADSINLLQQVTPTSGFVGEATIQIAEGLGLSLRVLSAQRTWMRVTVDGGVQFEGRTNVGESYTFNAANQILLLTGNGAALRIFFNEQDLGILGIYGEVISVIFSPEGAATPTVSPTPTIDPGILTSTAGAPLTPSATPSPTLQPTGTPTPTVDAGGG
jgi:cytoskeleton protein RodZ